MIQQRQAEIRKSLVETPVGNYEAYTRLVGEYQGIQWVLDTLNSKLAEND